MVKTSRFMEGMGGSMEEWERYRKWLRQGIEMYEDLLKCGEEAKEDRIGDKKQWERDMRYNEEELKELKERLARLGKWMHFIDE